MADAQSEQMRFFAMIFQGYATYFAAMGAVFWWDYLCTIKDEIRHVWRAKWSFAKLLFFLNRYGTFGMNIYWTLAFFGGLTDAQCRSWGIHVEAFGTPPIFLICEIILGLRCFALYRQNIWLGALLASLVLGETVVMFAALTGGSPAPVPPGVPGCFWTQGKDFVWVLWAFPCIFDTLVVGLIVWRCIQTRRLGGTTPLLELLMRDGLLYFGIVFAVNVFNVVFFVIALGVGFVNPVFNCALAVNITSIMCSRLVLNLRASFSRDVDQSESATGPTPRGTRARSRDQLTDGGQNNISLVQFNRAGGGAVPGRHPGGDSRTHDMEKGLAFSQGGHVVDDADSWSTKDGAGHIVITVQQDVSTT